MFIASLILTLVGFAGILIGRLKGYGQMPERRLAALGALAPAPGL